MPRSPQILPIDLGFPAEEAPTANDGGVFATEGMAEALGHGGGDRTEVRNPSRVDVTIADTRAEGGAEMALR